MYTKQFESWKMCVYHLCDTNFNLLNDYIHIGTNFVSSITESIEMSII